MKNPFESIKDIKARRLAFLENTVKYYNQSNRSIKRESSFGDCSYAPAHEKTKGCAIGRWLERDNRIILENPSKIVFDSSVCCHLPNWMAEMGLSFLSEIQELHDKDDFWGDKSLNRMGLDKVNEIKAVCI
jgi:hypothetical protein